VIESRELETSEFKGFVGFRVGAKADAEGRLGGGYEAGTVARDGREMEDGTGSGEAAEGEVQVVM